MKPKILMKQMRDHTKNVVVFNVFADDLLVSGLVVPQ